MTAPPQKRRVVLIEDSADLREALQGLLEDLGHDVVGAATGLEGVEQVLALLPDLTFVDMGLPDIDGFEVVRRLRAHPGGKALCLVALTGQAGDDARVRTLAAGFDRHVTKPISLTDLRKLLDESNGKART